VDHAPEPTLTITPATADDIADLADLAARTFPLACPPRTTDDDIAQFVAEHLSTAAFTAYLANPTRQVVLARHQGRPVGYTMCLTGEPADPAVRAVVTARPAFEINKIYTDAAWHSRGVAARLMADALDRAQESGAVVCWLGVNQENTRAQRFYTKHGFQVVGTKHFTVGGQRHDDFIMARPLP
jgi:ribosomal protein S18 acetylase RimI-like enzyme